MAENEMRKKLRLLIKDVGGVPTSDLVKEGEIAGMHFYYEGRNMTLFISPGNAWGVKMDVQAPQHLIPSIIQMAAKNANPAVAVLDDGNSIILIALSFNHHNRIRAEDVSMACGAILDSAKNLSKIYEILKSD